jgi:hypothetical protein
MSEARRVEAVGSNNGVRVSTTAVAAGAAARHRDLPVFVLANKYFTVND